MRCQEKSANFIKFLLIFSKTGLQWSVRNTGRERGNDGSTNDSSHKPSDFRAMRGGKGSQMTTFQDQFRKARGCSIPLVAARSADAVSTVQSVIGSLNGKSQNVPILQWDVMRGILGVNERGKQVAAELLNGGDAAMVSARPTDALGILSGVPEDSICLLHNLHLFWDDKPVMQAILNLRDRYKMIGAMLVGLNLTGSILPPELSEHTLVLDENLPTATELGELAKQIYADAQLPAPEEETISQATDATMGLSLFAAEQSLSLNMSKTGLNVAGTWERKRKMIEQTPGLQVWSGKETFSDLGGLEQFKSYVTAIFRGNEAPKIALFMDEIEKAVAQDSGNSTKTELIGILLSWFQDRDADGILMLGVPGAGKSAGVKAIGNEFGIPVVSFNLASMQDQYVGNSAKNLRKALATIDAMGNGKPCAFATCNRLDSLSPELRSRFKLGTFFFDLPDANERESIWKIYEAKYGVYRKVGEEFDSTGWTGREIRECCYKAYRLNIPLSESAKYIVPVSKSSAETIKTLRLQASGKFLSATDAGIYRYEETATAPSGRKFRE